MPNEYAGEQGTPASEVPIVSVVDLAVAVVVDEVTGLGLRTRRARGATAVQSSLVAVLESIRAAICEVLAEPMLVEVNACVQRARLETPR
jgi:hypothetical protein